MDLNWSAIKAQILIEAMTEGEINWRSLNLTLNPIDDLIVFETLISFAFLFKFSDDFLVQIVDRINDLILNPIQSLPQSDHAFS